MKNTILVVDDDPKLRDLLTEYLQANDFDVVGLPDGMEVNQNVAAHKPQLVVLDVMMPGKDGFDVLRELRAESRVPVIMLTARGDDADRIVGLEMGADDYLPKPFNPRELLARIKAVMRRYDSTDKPTVETRVLECSGLSLDTSRQQLTVEGDTVILSPAEARLLAALMQSPGTALSRDEIMNRMWGRDFEAFDRSIDVHVSKLRTLFKKYPNHADRIHTVWGTGYMLLED